MRPAYDVKSWQQNGRSFVKLARIACGTVAIGEGETFLDAVHDAQKDMTRQLLDPIMLTICTIGSAPCDYPSAAGWEAVTDSILRAGIVRAEVCSVCGPRRQVSGEEYDRRRGSAAVRGYDARWRRYAAAFLLRNPLCATHLESGRVVAAQVVDHKGPHRGDASLFWDRANHQALCVRCHNAKTAREDVQRDRGGRIAGRVQP